MNFALTDEQQDLRAAAARLLADRCPPERVAALADAGTTDRDAWPELLRQGWCDPDLGTLERCLLAEESGYALHATPWWSTAGLAHPVFRAAGLSPGDGPLTLAWQDDPGSPAAGCRADRGAGGWRLSGVRGLVTDAGEAAAVVVAAAGPDGTALFVAPAEGVAVEPRPCLDAFRGAARLRFRDTPAELLVDAGTAPDVLAGARRHAGVLLACEAVGVARRALDLARRHAQDRVQFGRPIGAYQAVAHRLADGYVAVELATSLALRAAWLIGTDGPEADQAYAEAAVAARRAAVRTCEDAMQVTGGLGATWEFPLHRWYRRALWLDSFDTSTATHLATLADRLLAGRR